MLRLSAPLCLVEEHQTHISNVDLFAPRDVDLAVFRASKDDAVRRFFDDLEQSARWVDHELDVSWQNAGCPDDADARIAAGADDETLVCHLVTLGIRARNLELKDPLFLHSPTPLAKNGPMRSKRTQPTSSIIGTTMSTPARAAASSAATLRRTFNMRPCTWIAYARGLPFSSA